MDKRSSPAIEYICYLERTERLGMQSSRASKFITGFQSTTHTLREKTVARTICCQINRLSMVHEGGV